LFLGCGSATPSTQPSVPSVEVGATPEASTPEVPASVARSWRYVPQRGHQRDGVWGIAFTGDGRTFVTSSKDRSVRVWDAVTGRIRAVLPTGGDVADDVDVNADGTLIAAAGYQRVRLYDASTGSLLPGYENPSGWVSSVAFHPKDTLLAAGGMREARVWDTKDGTLVDTIPGLPDEPRALEWSRDGSLLALGMGRHVWVWDVKARSRRHVLGPVGVLAWNVGWLSESVVAAADGAGVRLWDASSGASTGFLRLPAFARGVAGSPDGASVAACHGGSVTLLDKTNGTQRWTSAASSGDTKVVAFSPSGDVVAVGTEKGAVRVVDARSGQARHDVSAFEGAYESVQFASNGQGLVRTRGESVLVEGASWKVVRAWGSDRLVMFASGGTRIVNVGEDAIEITDVAGAKPSVSLPRPAWTPNAAALSMDGRIFAVAGAEAGAVRVVDLSRRAAARDLKVTDPVIEMTFTASGKRLIANVAASSPILIDVTSGKATTLEGGDGHARFSAAWDDQGAQVATWGGGKAIKLRDGETGAVQRVLEAPGDVRGVALGGAFLASLGEGGRVVFWDLARGAVAREVETGATEPTRIASSPDGRFVVVVSDTETRWVRREDGAVVIVDWIDRQAGSLPIAAMDGGRCDGPEGQLDRIVFRDGPDMVRGELTTCRELGAGGRREGLLQRFGSGAPL
jgi:WD40 repeat protein